MNGSCPKGCEVGVHGDKCDFGKFHNSNNCVFLRENWSKQMCFRNRKKKQFVTE